MSGPTKSDAEIEALLRATFSTEARNQVPDARAVPPFPATERLATVHPFRRRWTGVTLVAAAVIAVLVGAFVVGNQVLESERKPAPAGTSVPPEPSVTASSPSTTPTSPTTTASTAPAVTTKQVTYEGLTLTVPKAWNLITPAFSQPNPGACLSTDTQEKETGTETDNCELSVTVGGSAFNDDQDPDSPGFTPDGGICGTDGRTPNETTTVSADEIEVDGERAEHRVFTGFCLQHDIDEWTVVTAPFVQFTRRVAASDPGADAAALAVVQSAKLPGPRSSLRLFDRGLITAVSATTISLDRVTYLQGKGVQNTNPATYDYPVSSATDITYFRNGAATLTRTLSLDELRSLVAGVAVHQGAVTIPSLVGLDAVLTTDGTHVTSIRYSDTR